MNDGSTYHVLCPVSSVAYQVADVWHRLFLRRSSHILFAFCCEKKSAYDSDPSWITLADISADYLVLELTISGFFSKTNLFFFGRRARNSLYKFSRETEEVELPPSALSTSLEQSPTFLCEKSHLFFALLYNQSGLKPLAKRK